MQFATDDIKQLIETAWHSVLGLELSTDPDLMDPMSHHHTVAASVQISGGWNGALVVFCQADLGRRVAAIMFDVENGELAVELVQDAMGELANIIGGGIKGLVDGECHLSLPTVADGTVYSLRVRGGRVVKEMGFRSGGHQFKVSLLERDSQAH